MTKGQERPTLEKVLFRLPSADPDRDLASVPEIATAAGRSSNNLEFFVLLNNVARGWRKQADQLLRDYGLSEAQAWPLVLIYRASGRLRIQDLAEQLGLESSSLVRHLDQLCTSGLITREEDPDDRRAKNLGLTRRGTRFARKIETAVNAFRDSIMACVDDTDLLAALAVLKRVEARLSGKTEPGERLSQENISS
jgi:MarR family transcriptional regulator for hemolysin